MNEADWIRRSQEGDEEAFESLVRAKQESVFWLAYRIVGNREDAKDVAQLVFIRLWSVIGKYRPDYSFNTWLYRIVVNLSIDYFRKEVVKRRLSQSLDDPKTTVSLHAVGQQQAHQSFGEISRIFNEVSKRLTPQQRAAFALKEIDNIPTREVARILDVRQSTVRNHLFQARKTLQEEIRRRYPDYIPGGA